MSEMKWYWRGRPPGHEQQPWLECQIEQLVALVLLWMVKRAIRRDDRQTKDRVLAIFKAGAVEERRHYR